VSAAGAAAGAGASASASASAGVRACRLRRAEVAQVLCAKVRAATGCC